MLIGTLALFVVSLGYGVIVPLLPALAGGRAATDEALLSAVYAGYAAAKIATQVPGGVWVDRAGAGRVLRLALGLFSLSLAGFLLRGDLVAFTAIRAVEGAATGLVYPACFALALRGAKPERIGRRMGVMAGLGTSGLLVGPALGALLAPFGPRVPVVVALVASVAVTLAALIRPAPPPVERPTRTVRQETGALVALLGNLAFMALMLPIAYNKLTFSAFQGLLPLYGPDWLGVGTRGVAALFVLTGVCFAASQPVGGWLADRFAPRAVVLALTFPLLAALGAQSAAPGPWSFGAAYGAYIICSSLIFTATMKHAARAFGTEQTYGGLFGMLGTLTDLMTIAGPLLFLNLYAVSGRWIYAVMAATGVPFAVGYALFARPRAATLRP